MACQTSGVPREYNENWSAWTKGAGGGIIGDHL